MGMTQLLIVGGSLLLLAIDVVFGVLLREYFIGEILWLAAVAILLTYFGRARLADTLPFAYETVLVAGALAIAIVGARGLLFDVVSLVRSPTAWNALELLGLVGYAVAVVAVGWGAWQLLRGRR